MLAIITDVHYRMSLALIRDLARAGVTVIACETDAHPTPLGFASRYPARRVTLSQGNDLEDLYSLCIQLSREFGEKPALLPVGAKTLARLSAARDRFASVCGLAIPTPEQLALLNDKSAVHALGEQLGLPVPREYHLTGEESAFFDAIPLPCVVKPLCGEQFGLSAASRYRVAHTRRELEDAFHHFQSITGQLPLVQEYLPGGALGCSVLARDGEVLATLCHRRVREYPVSGGPSACCRSLEDPALCSIAQSLISATGFTGLAMVEFKEDASGSPRLLEVNPRIWGTYPLTSAAGTNFSLLWCCLALGVPMPEYRGPKRVTMTYHPADLAAALGYVRRGELSRAAGALRDLLDPRVKNGLHRWSDPGPSLAYCSSLLRKGKRP